MRHDWSFEAHAATDGTAVVRLRPVQESLETAFLAAYRHLRKAATSLSDAGIVVGAYHEAERAVSVATLDVDARELPYLVVGRHPRCHVQLEHDASVALRHL